MNRIEEIYSVARSLPLPDRLRLAERLVHDAVEASAPVGEGEGSMIGLFADETDLVDEVCRMAMEDRAKRPLRASDG